MPTLHVRGRTLRHACICAALMSACTPENLVAPNGSIIAVSTERTVTAAGGDSVYLVVTVQQQGGLQVDDHTIVLLSTNLGSLRDGATSERRGLLRLTTKGGLASAWFFPGDVGGSATITGKSGTASGTGVLLVADAVAPDGASVLWSVQSDTVAQGSTTQVRAYLRTKAQAPVTEGTRVILQASSGNVSPTISLTRSGFLDLRFTAAAQAGRVWLLLRSGPLLDSLAIAVR